MPIAIINGSQNIKPNESLDQSNKNDENQFNLKTEKSKNIYNVLTLTFLCVIIKPWI
jgi:hypothetical protein